jgi:hypothetical protein
MVEIRNVRPWMHNPRDKTWRRSEWQRTYLCIGGIRLGIVNLAASQRGWGVRPKWRWSWRGLEIDTGRYRWYAGWMAPQFREDN